MDQPQDQPSLDTLRQRALAGDPAAEAALFEDLRVRFLALAKRRVQPDHAEDVVQEALGVVLRKLPDLPPDRGLLVWSLTVLRNVIGNHYQARRRDTAQTVQVDDWHAVPEARVADDPSPRSPPNRRPPAWRRPSASWPARRPAAGSSSPSCSRAWTRAAGRAR
ncbi:MAG: sigma factor [Candidatus Krumholzibacteriia bacterium]